MTPAPRGKCILVGANGNVIETGKRKHVCATLTGSCTSMLHNWAFKELLYLYFGGYVCTVSVLGMFIRNYIYVCIQAHVYIHACLHIYTYTLAVANVALMYT